VENPQQAYQQQSSVGGTGENLSMQLPEEESMTSPRTHIQVEEEESKEPINANYLTR